MIKLIATDMDGTLLNDEMELSAENITAIKQAQNAGMTVIVATGRSVEEARPILQDAGINVPIITSNGAQIFDKDGKNTFTVGLDTVKLKTAMAILRQHEIYFELFTDKGGYTENKADRLASVAHWLKSTSPDLTEDEALVIAKSHMATLPIKAAENFDEIVARQAAGDLSVLKIFAMAQIGDKNLARARQELDKLPGLAVTSSGSNNIEINHIDAQKGKSLEKVADRLGISLSDVAALGDNFNDISMLERVGASIAMANAEPAVKKIAKYQTLKNTENGVAHAIDKLINQVWE
ncbi:Cof-type HAD-IIB family hydrolase [Lactococcus insecticola]|uniref:Haloacid dehalogenase n=1 Tax=Pseudolactococcus insecticola TaxID=2709158 RepID=A0A6A0B8K3_9LACT|nr:Cof-type HAD-IIB family hydrolase [Lactococcus insecticola]GFH40761.1 haloacid dehalogenase [Lactococcus insecticola]